MTGCIFINVKEPAIYEKIDTYLKVIIPGKLDEESNPFPTIIKNINIRLFLH